MAQEQLEDIALDKTDFTASFAVFIRYIIFMSCQVIACVVSVFLMLGSDSFTMLFTAGLVFFGLSACRVVAITFKNKE